MKHRDLDESKIVYKGDLVCERWETVRSKFGNAEVERYWIIRKVKVSNKLTEITELLGYRCILPRSIAGNICIKPEDAIVSAEAMYEQNLEKMSKVLDK